MVLSYIKTTRRLYYNKKFKLKAMHWTKSDHDIRKDVYWEVIGKLIARGPVS
jgi:hypothetical protein